ncbi:MAG: hypothetical protein M0Q51_14955 [Bacteroidales bacterium]|nr:hypothetical protein [Bacteroidales bacterium]
MEFTLIENLNIGIDLSILQRTTQRHSILLYQHGGALHADNTRIGNHNNVTHELSLFFEKSRLTACDLALTPEYSCPLLVIEDIISHPEKWPTADKLWVVGCESMTKQQLTDFHTNYNIDNVYVHYDTAVLKNQLNYVDPLIYLFRGTHDGLNKLIVLLQFKTHHQSVWSGEVERNNLIQGNEIYILRNPIHSVNFLSLICSEAMNFQAELTQQKQKAIGWIDSPYLIYNPQLNPDPANPIFTAFRKFVFLFGKKEIISLNWNKSTTYNGVSFLKYDAARSGFYIQSGEINLDENRIKYNHSHGLYYFYFGMNKHAFILNSSPIVFNIATPPVDIVNAMPQQSRRDGPELIEVYGFNAVQNDFESLNDGINDLHVDYLNGVGCICNFLISHHNCILEKEKLVCLTSGKINKELGSNWTNILNLFSINIDQETEVNRRITFAEDTHPMSLRQRTEFIDTITELNNNILPNKTVYPESIADLKAEDLVIGYHINSRADNYKFNILTDTGEGRIATICFMGSMPDDVIEKTFDFLQALFDDDNNNKRRVVVFYRRGNRILSKSDPNAGKITVTSDFDGPTFLKQ